VEADATPQIFSQPEAGDLGKKVGRGVDVVKEEGQREEVPDAENDAPEQHGGTRTEEAGRKVPPAQDWALPHRAIPEVDEELEHGGVRVVPVQDADKGTPVQELRQVEAATENNAGGDSEKDRKRKEPVHNQGNVCGRAVHGSGPGLLENDEGGGEGGAAGAATRTNGGEGGGRYTVSVGAVLSSVTLSLSLSFSLSFSVTLSFFLLTPLSFFLSLLFSSLFGGQAGRGQGESPRAAGGLFEDAADGEREGLYIISS